MYLLSKKSPITFFEKIVPAERDAGTTPIYTNRKIFAIKNAPTSGGNTDEVRKEDIMRENLKAARKAKGMTQQQVAEYLGITVLAYKRIEYGQRVGRVETWDKLEDLFGIHQRKLREDINGLDI